MTKFVVNSHDLHIVYYAAQMGFGLKYLDFTEKFVWFVCFWGFYDKNNWLLWIIKSVNDAYYDLTILMHLYTCYDPAI